MKFVYSVNHFGNLKMGLINKSVLNVDGYHDRHGAAQSL